MRIIGYLPGGGIIYVEVPPVATPALGRQDTVPGEQLIDKPLGPVVAQLDQGEAVPSDPEADQNLV